jgi:hypothetical protein
VLVEGCGAGVHAGHVQRHFHLAGLGGLVEFHGALLLVETGAVGGGAEVVDFEGGEGVGGVDGVLAGAAWAAVANRLAAARANRVERMKESPV